MTLQPYSAFAFDDSHIAVEIDSLLKSEEETVPPNTFDTINSIVGSHIRLLPGLCLLCTDHTPENPEKSEQVLYLPYGKKDADGIVYLLKNGQWYFSGEIPDGKNQIR